ncbi:MAG: hypothetical protein NZ750_13460 [Anaerolineae bacterium]|nr:hypothetical protein [Anaerolineae bacterium]MDW8172806.1 hypothetical protein [Anaerolineae bacterium]
MKHVGLWALVVALLVAFWLRTFDWLQIPPGIYNDEANYLVRQWRIVVGAGLPLHFEDSPEPFDSFVRALWLRWVGVTPLTSRLFSIFLGMVAVASAAALARALYHDQPQRVWIALTTALAMASVIPIIVIGRSVYRANWLPMASALALALLAHYWQTRRPSCLIAAGFMGGIATSFYLGGLAFPLAFGAILGLSALLNPRARLSWRCLLALGLSWAVAMLPWFYLFLRVPNWLNWRLNQVSQETAVPIATPASLLEAFGRAIQPFISPSSYFEMIRYSTFSAPFISLPFLILAVLGLLATLWRWRRVGAFLPVLAFGVMILPSVLSDAPETPIRMLGVFAPLAVLSGLGAGLFLNSMMRLGLAWAGRGALILICVYAPLAAFADIRYHFVENPVVRDESSWLNLANFYRLGARAFWQTLIDSPQPVYVPLENLNELATTAWLRPVHFPRMEGYAGQSLPAGEVIVPVQDKFGLPVLNAPVPLQFALLLPAESRIVALPPLTMVEGQALQARMAEEGQPFISPEGWPLGQRWRFDAAQNPFNNLPAPPDGPPLATFDDRLEVLALDAPLTATPGETIPVTLYWRVPRGSAKDYYADLQVWDVQSQSIANENRILWRYVYPVPMWQVGEVVTETRWLRLSEDAAQGGYRIMLRVSDYPGPTPVQAIDRFGTTYTWWEAARLSLPLATFPEPPAQARSLNVIFAQSLALTHVQLEPPLSALRPGHDLVVNLYWRALRPAPADYTIFLHLRDSSGSVVAQQDEALLGTLYPTKNWLVGERIFTTHRLRLPEGAAAPQALVLGLYAWPSLERASAGQDGALLEDGIVLLTPD